MVETKWQVFVRGAAASVLVVLLTTLPAAAHTVSSAFYHCGGDPGRSFGPHNCADNSDRACALAAAIAVKTCPDFPSATKIGVTLNDADPLIGVYTAVFAGGWECDYGFRKFGQRPKNNGPSCENEVGNPINAGVGNKYQVETDVEAPAPGLLTFQRFYNSDVSSPSSQFGSKWSHTFNRHAIGSGAASSTVMHMQRANGRLLRFEHNGTAFQADPDVFDKLERRMSGATITGWKLTVATDRSIESYDLLGRLERVDYPSGDYLVVTYTVADIENENIELVDGFLEKVTDAQGRTLRFFYRPDNLIDRVVDDSGNAVSFGYSVVPGAATLLSEVTYPGSLTRQYRYDEAGLSPSGTRGLLTGIVDERNVRTNSWRYESDGSGYRANLSVRGASTDFTDRVEITYGASSATIRTFSTSSTYNDRVVTFETHHGVVKRASATEFCSSCGGDVALTTFDPVTGQRDTTTDFRGTTTNYDIDVNGLETVRVEAESSMVPGPPATRRIETDWNVSLRVPLEIRVEDASGSLKKLTRYAYNARGQTTATCEIDVANTAAAIAARAYACGSSTDAPDRVVQTRYTYCESINTAPPDPIGAVGENLSKGCPRLGLLRRVDGPRTGVVRDWTTQEFSTTTSCTVGIGCTRAGDLRRTINAVGHVTEILGRDANGRVIGERDANATITNFTYHPRGWLLTMTVRANASGSSPSDAITTRSYDAVGNLDRLTGPTGSYLDYDYDAASRTSQVFDNTGASIQYTRDARGHVTIERTFASGGVLSRRIAAQYDLLGRVDKRRDALAATGLPLSSGDMLDNSKGRVTADFNYDSNGNRVEVLDGLGRDTDVEYDSRNRPRLTLDALRPSCPIGDANCGRTAVSRDELDNITSVTDPKGLATNYTHDGLNNLVAQNSPDSGSRTSTFDSARNRVSDTDARTPAITTNFTYDALGRLNSISYPTTALNTMFQYDVVQPECGTLESFPTGRLTRMTDASGETRYCYDRRGNVVRKVQINSGTTRVTTYAYDLADRVKAVGYPSGLVAIYTRDSLGRIAQVSRGFGDANASSFDAAVVTSAKYLPMGPIAEVTFAGPHSSVRTYDLNYNIDKVTSDHGAGLQLDYTVDVAGRVVGITDVIAGAPKNEFIYDALDRLTDVRNTSSLNIEAYTYDATGNRTSKQTGSAPAVAYTYPATSHRLQSVGTGVRLYDGNGNTTSNSEGAITWTSTYDDRNRLVSATDSTQSLQFQYNGKGERLRKIAGDATDYVFNEAGQLIGEYTPAAENGAEYFWLDNLPIAVSQVSARRGAGWLFLHSDHLGTPRRALHPASPTTDTAPRWEWMTLNNPFGETQPPSVSTCASGDPCSAPALNIALRFPGQIADLETGLHYNYFRDYDSSSGRYLQSDPIGLTAGISTYSYAESSPLRLIDIYGLQTELPPGPYNPPSAPDPTPDGRDPRTPWDPPALRTPRRHCSPYYAVDSQMAQFGVVMASLVKEDPPITHGCRRTVLCHYLAQFAVRFIQHESGRTQADIAKSEFTVQLKFRQNDCCYEN